MKKVFVLSAMLLFVLLGWAQSASVSQQINIKYKNGNSVQIDAKDVDYIEFKETESNPDTPTQPDTPVNPSTPPTVGYAVDLGLSVKWASYNVGATSCEEYGDRYAWGELEPKSKYKLENYQFYDFEDERYIDIGTNIGGTAYDVAHVKWGGGWRMPTWFELSELRSQCTWTWSKVNGVNGYIVKGKNGNSIFFPVGGNVITLWACTMYNNKLGGRYGVAQLIRFSNSSYTPNNSGEDRWRGNYIRPVCSSDDDISGTIEDNNDIDSGGDKSDCYLTFVAQEAGTFKFSGTEGNDYISYSLDNGRTWNTLASSTNSPTVTSGNKIMWKGTLSGDGIGSFSSTGRFVVEGNIMSLLFGDDFKGKTNLYNTSLVFFRLFDSCQKLTNAKNLVLPATTLGQLCYCFMFANCTSLVTAPKLPATTLAVSCYSQMFDGCTSLKAAPELPALILASNCYYGMFGSCTSLTTVPTLPATTLANACYWYMFNNCTSLTSVPTNYLPATTLVSWCYSQMFYKCTRLATAPELPATTLAESCYKEMFANCYSLTTAPQLPATTLVESCYDYMFYNCRNLNCINCLAKDISATNCTTNWLYNVAHNGIFVKNSSMSGWSRGVDGIPNNWTVQNE